MGPLNGRTPLYLWGGLRSLVIEQLHESVWGSARCLVQQGFCSKELFFP